MPVQALEINSGPLPVAPHNVQASQLSITLVGLIWSMQIFLSQRALTSSSKSRVRELSLAQVSCFCGYHHHGLDPLLILWLLPLLD